MENFDSIYKDNHKRVLNFVINKINYITDAEELTNDVFMKVHKHLANFDEDKASMTTWIMNITKNSVIDYYRKKREKIVSLDESNDKESDNVGVRLMDTITSSSNPHKEMVSSETMDRIQDELSSLPDTYRDIASLFFNEELSYDEISTRLEIPLGTVKGQISRVRAKLVSRLETVRI